MSRYNPVSKLHIHISQFYITVLFPINATRSEIKWLFQSSTLSSQPFILYLLRIRYHAGMNKFNGPFLASFTDLWKVWYTYTHGTKPIYVDLHEQYGDIVRVGPKDLSFADPRAIREIYGPRGANQKVVPSLYWRMSDNYSRKNMPCLPSQCVENYMKSYSQALIQNGMIVKDDLLRLRSRCLK